jgi:amino acid adenylation domain-containing protein
VTTPPPPRPGLSVRADELRKVVGEVLGVPVDQLRGRRFGALGGSSLDAVRAAVAIRERVGVVVHSRTLQDADDVYALAEDLAGQPTSPPPATGGRPHEEDGTGGQPCGGDGTGPGSADGGALVPLTWQQRLIWYQSLLAPGSPRYHFYALLHFAQPPDVARLGQLLNRQLARHPALRIRIVFWDGQPWQQVPEGPVSATEVDLIEVRLSREVGAPEELVAAVGADADFDLARGPLVRWRLAVLPDGSAVLVHAEHHLVHDGRSFQAFLSSLSAGTGEVTADRRYLAYARGQREPDPERVAQVARECRRAGPALFPDPLAEPAASDRFLRLPIPGRLLGEVRAAARRCGVTLFTALFAAFSQALATHRDRDTLALGCAVDNRPAGHEDTVGMFVSVVPVVVDRRPAEPADAVVRRVDRALAAAVRQADVPLSDIVEHLDRADRRTTAAGPISAAFSMHQQPEEAVEVAGQGARVELGVFNGAAKFPVNVVALATGAGADTRVTLLMEGAADAVTDDDLWALWTLMLSWLRRWASPDARSSDARVLAAPVSGGGPDGISELVARVEAHAATAGGEVALDDGRHRLRYRDLAALAATARARLGWGPGHLVGIAGAASARYFATAYAVLFAGATYLPLPADRPVRTVVDTARRASCHLVVDLADPEVSGDSGGGDRDSPGDHDSHDSQDGRALRETLAQQLPGTPVVDWRHLTGEAPSPPPLPAGRTWPTSLAPAYVIYTSGSTGVPKGVVIGRPALDRLAAWCAGELGLSAGTVVAQNANVGFDASVFEVWPALYAGARVSISPAELRSDPHDLAEWLTGQGVECAFLPTPMAEIVSSLRTPPQSLRVMYTGGDRLHPVPDGLPYRLLNCYGPTEATVLCTAGWVRPGDTGLPPIGHALPYAYVQVVRPDGARVADGVTGELWVGGAGLAEGYLDDPLLTAARFVVDPYGDGATRVYRTGDLVRSRPGGNLDFVGRDDRQIQVGGIRTELGELEAGAFRVAGIRQAAAVAGADDGGRSWLRLYVQPAVGTDPVTLVRQVRDELPAHVRHLTVECVDAIPSTPNGKVDRNALRRWTGPGPAGGGSAAEPGTVSRPPAGAANLLPALTELTELSPRDALTLASRLIDSVIEDLPVE